MHLGQAIPTLPGLSLHIQGFHAQDESIGTSTDNLSYSIRLQGIRNNVLARIIRLIGIDLPSNRNRRSVGDRRDHHRCSWLAMSIPHLPERAAVSSTWAHVSVRHRPPAFRILVYSAPGSQNVASVKDARSIDARERKLQDIWSCSIWIGDLHARQSSSWSEP